MSAELSYLEKNKTKLLNKHSGTLSNKTFNEKYTVTPFFNDNMNISPPQYAWVLLAHPDPPSLEGTS